MSAAKEKIFDTLLYSNSSEPVVREDLAGLVVEASRLSLEQRINPRRLEVRGNKVIDPNTGLDIFEHFRHETLLDEKESAAGIAFYNYLASGPPGSLVISVSPSGGETNYTEARINVGIRISSEEIELYGIPSCLSPISLMDRSISLAEHLPKPMTIKSPEALREIPIPVVVPAGRLAWDFLQEVFPLDSQAWDAIKKRDPWLVKQKAIDDIKPVAAELFNKIGVAVSEADFIMAGAWAETRAAHAGWIIDTSGCAGLSNTQLVKMLSSFDVRRDIFGNQRLVLAGWEYHKGTCVNCKKYTDIGPCGLCKTCESKYN